MSQEEKDSWEKANELEREGRLQEALEIYIKNAENGSNLAISAINFLSAAKCAVKLGKMDEAKDLFRKAGEFYEKLGESLEEESYNYAEWAYRMASNCYRLSGDLELSNRATSKAEKIKKI